METQISGANTVGHQPSPKARTIHSDARIHCALFPPAGCAVTAKTNINKSSLDAARRGRDSVRRVDGAASIAPFVSTRHCKCINNQNLKEKRKNNNKKKKRCLDVARRGRDNVRGVNGEASITPLMSTPHSKKKKPQRGRSLPGFPPSRGSRCLKEDERDPRGAWAANRIGTSTQDLHQHLNLL